VGPCDYRVWDVRTPRSRWWAVSIRGRRVVLPITFSKHQEFTSAPKVIAYRVAVRKREAAELEKLLGKRARALTPVC
jgi:hypothetical protein